MELIEKIFELAIEEYMKEHGEDAQLEDGEEFVTVFEDGVLIVRFGGKELEIELILGQPYTVDISLEDLMKEEV